MEFSQHGEDPKLRFRHYQITSHLQDGIHHSVHLAYDTRDSTKKQLILKVSKIQSNIHPFSENVSTYSQLNHPNLIKVHDCFYDEPSKMMVIVLEYAEGGALQDKIQNYNEQPPDRVRQQMIELISGLEYLHSKGIVHGNLRPSSILIDGNGKFKISEFGRCHLNEMCFYEAPEQKIGDYKADLFSLGIIFYQLAYGKYPFDTQYANLESKTNSLKGFKDLLKIENIDNQMTEHQIDKVISGLLEVQADKRISLQKALELLQAEDYVREAKSYDLYSASCNGKLMVVKYFVEECKVDPQASKNDGWIPLMSAASKGQLEVVRYFIDECGVDPKTPTKNGLIALMFAAEGGHLNIVKYFVTECKVDPKTSGKNGQIALSFAASKGHLNIVKYFVEECKVSPNIPQNDGWVPLMAATYGGQIEIVKYLVLECKVDPRTAMNNGQIALHFAADRGYLNIVKLFVEDFEVEPRMPGNNGQIALMSAAAKGHLDVVKYFVYDCEVDPKSATTDGWIALMSAAYGGYLDIIKFFVYDCEIDPRTTTENGSIAMMSAVEGGHLDIVKFFVTEFEIDPKTARNDGKTAIDLAKNNVIIEYLGSFY